MSFRIAYLADESRHLPTLAEWLHGEWGARRPGATVEGRARKLESQMRRRQIPCGFVAVEDGRPLGCASLVEHDMETHVEWSPWLAGVYVHPDHRRRGVGSALVERVTAEAALLDVPSLYLFTRGQERLYGRLGWRPIIEEPYAGRRVTIMVRDLSRERGPPVLRERS